MPDRDFVLTSGLQVANTGALQYGGVTLANSVTGTGSMVLSANPTITGNLTVSVIKANSALGSTGQALLANSTGGAYWGTVASVAGANTNIQFNDSGIANGTSGFTFDKAANSVFVANNITAGTTVNANNGIFINNANVTSSYTIAAGFNGLSAGPITIANGITVTVSSGQRWIIL